MMERLNYIDVSKGIGILCLITFTHNFFLPSFLLNIDGYILMPFFLFLNGVVYKNDSISKTIKKKIKSLLVPYILFCLIGFIYYIALEINGDLSLYLIWLFFKSMIYGTPKALSTYYMNPLWYIYSLFFVTILYTIITNYCNNKKIYIIIFLFIVGASLSVIKLNFGIKSLPINIDVIFLSLFFLHLGNMSKKFEIYKLGKWYVVLVALILIFLLVYVFNERVTLAFNDIHDYPIFIIISLVGIIFLLSVSIIIKNNSILSKLGSLTIYILGFHWIILHGVLYKIYTLVFNTQLNITTRFDNNIYSLILAITFFVLQLLIIYPLIFPIRFTINYINKHLLTFIK